MLKHTGQRVALFLLLAVSESVSVSCQLNAPCSFSLSNLVICYGLAPSCSVYCLQLLHSVPQYQLFESSLPFQQVTFHCKNFCSHCLLVLPLSPHSLHFQPSVYQSLLCFHFTLCISVEKFGSFTFLYSISFRLSFFFLNLYSYS